MIAWKYPCCVCPVTLCQGSKCPVADNEEEFEQNLLNHMEREIPEDLPEDKIQGLLFEELKKLPPKEVALLNFQIS